MFRFPLVWGYLRMWVPCCVSGSVAALLSWGCASDTSLCSWVTSGQLLEGMNQRGFSPSLPLWQISGHSGSQNEALAGTWFL